MNEKPDSALADVVADGGAIRSPRPADADASAADERSPDSPPCCCKTTARDDDERRRLCNRLSRIEGQIRGIRGMIERDAYCNDVLTQSAAVSAAVDAFNRELIASHIKNCVVRDIRAGNDDVVDELIDTLRRLMK